MDEDFAVRVIRYRLFGGTSPGAFKRVEPGRVRVEMTHGEPPSVPILEWRGAGGTIELSEAVGQLGKEIVRDASRALWFSNQKSAGWMKPGPKQAIAYVQAGQAPINALPTQQQWLRNAFFGRGGWNASL